MLAQTVVCPSCRAELKLPPKLPPGLTAAKCPKCGGVVPLGPPAPAPSGPPTHPASDTDASVADRTRQYVPAARPASGAYPFLAPPQSSDEVGRLGHYRILSELGRGGMGVVFAAEDMNLRRPVALKVMLPQFAASPADRARFLREARAQAAVDHDHVAAIFQVGEEVPSAKPEGFGGVPYIVMPLLRGMSLADALKVQPDVPLAEAVRIVREMAEGLAAAHEQGLVHRDIKPGNVWLEGKGRRVKILDFGLARVAETGADEPEVTQQGAIVGTPAYMSPEQARGEHLDARTDLWSLGVVLYQLLAGRQPFRGAGTTATLIAVATETPPPPSEHNPEVPQALDAIALALLEKDPARRPHSAEVVADALRAVETGGVPAVVLRSTLPPPGAPADPWGDIDVTQAEEPELEPVSDRTIRHAREPEAGPGGRRKLFLLAGAFALALAAVIVAAVVSITTSTGTLVVEINDAEGEARYLGGKLVLAEGGKDRYTLTSAERNKSIGTGTYTVRLEGTDGLMLDTREFALKRGETVTVRIALAPKPRPKYPSVGPLPSFDSDRRAADRVLALGGSVRVNGENTDITTVAQLPREPFRLTFASLARTKITDLGLEDFKGSRNLTHLYLSDTTITDAGLANFKDCADLTVLDLLNVKVTDAGLAHLRNCKRVTTLNLFHTLAGDEGVAQFKDSKDAMTFFNLAATRATDKGVAHYKGCTNLTFLNLSETAITAQGVANFRDNKKLLTLWLNQLPLTDDDLAPFAECEALYNLSVGQTKLTDAGLARFRGCTNLGELFLWSTQITDAGLVHLKSLPNLKILNLSSTAITDAGLEHLAECKSLTSLNLWNTPVTDAGADALRKLKGLTWLDLRKTTVTEEAVERLRQALPACKIEWDAGAIPAAAAAADRAAAEYALSIGGAVCVNGEFEFRKAAAELPKEPFRLTAASFIDNKQVADEGLAVFEECRNLRYLALTRTGVGDAGLAHFRNCKNLGQLFFSRSKVTDAGLVQFKDSPRVTAISLSGTAVTDAGLENFKGCKNLWRVWLSETAVTDAGLAHLGDCKNLTLLYLNKTAITDAGLAHFRGCKKLLELSIADVPLTGEGLLHFAESKSLTILYLNGTGVKDDALAAFAGCKRLTKLNLFGTRVTDAGLAHFAESTLLTELTLTSLAITDKGLAHLRDARGLQTVRLSDTQITDAALVQLAACPGLAALDVRKTKVTEEGVEKFRQAVPKCKVEWDAGATEPKDK